MTFTKIQLGSALAIGIALVALIAGIGSMHRFEDINMLLIPGALLGALFFPQGIEGDHAYLYLAIAALIDVIIFALLALLFIRMRSKNTTDAL